ncbi:MAG: FmdB family zinc ribbon protein [Thermoanaerobaculia bacterium]
MPLYEYACRGCGKRFEQFVSGEAKPACPECESRRVSKLLSVFAVGASGTAPKSAAEPSGAACGSCGDPRGPGACSIG